MLLGRCRYITICLGFESQDATARSEIEHAALESQGIDTGVGESVVGIMAIAMITIITIESILGAKPYHALFVLCNTRHSLRTIQGDIHKTLSLDGTDYQRHQQDQRYFVWEFTRLFHVCKITHSCAILQIF